MTSERFYRACPRALNDSRVQRGDRLDLDRMWQMFPSGDSFLGEDAGSLCVRLFTLEYALHLFLFGASVVCLSGVARNSELHRSPIAICS